MASTPKKNPGPKPEYQVVEHSLHCQTDEGEIILDLRLPIAKLEKMMEIEDLDIDDKKMPRWPARQRPQRRRQGRTRGHEGRREGLRDPHAVRGRRHGAARCRPGGIARLYRRVGEHRAALAHDFRRYYGLSLSEIGRSIPYREAIDLVDELEREIGSHYMAAKLGWSFAAGYGELMAGLHLSAFINANRDPKSTPVEVMLPWTVAEPEEQVSAAERAHLREQLRKRSAIQH
jgi:hypothetical protein